MGVRMYLRTYVYVCLRVYVCIYAIIYVCTYACMYARKLYVCPANVQVVEAGNSISPHLPLCDPSP